MQRRRVLGMLGGAAGLAVLGGGGMASASFALGQRRAAEHWAASQYPKLAGVGSVKSLTILPLIDWYPDRDGLVGESGLSYLIRADDTTLLFDVGFNLRREHPSPLLRNMAALDVRLTDVDALVISHPHVDHIGGVPDQVTLSSQPVEPLPVTAYLPAALASPTTQSVVVDAPRVIAPGVASMGAISSQDFLAGWTLEQSLAVNVAGKGIVVVVGCGHPTVQRIVDRAKMLFDEPVHGVVGGLHFPVTDSRARALGLPMQKLIGTGKWPWSPIDEADVAAAIAYLGRHDPKLVAVSAHDSCDWSLEAFRAAFGPAYRDVRIGEEIVV